MTARDVSESIKRATVAVMTRRANSTPEHPFKIIGSGFCVHPAGIVLTANHVFQSFVKDQHHKSVLERVGEGVLVPTPITIDSDLGRNRFVHIDLGTLGAAIKQDAECSRSLKTAMSKSLTHPAFPNGFPQLEVADYADLHEMMAVATCGYPFGDFLWNQVGSVTSSFTTGMISSILPAPGIAREHLSGFQLDLLSAPGNSGGPIFDSATGKVFGVLQGGPVDPKGNPILGITTAEPVYPAFDQGLIEKLLAHAAQPSKQP